MTALVTQLFITMIPIDCKFVKKNPYTFLYFFGNNHNIGELTSTTLKEQLTKNIIFTGTMKNLYAYELRIHACSPHYAVLKTEKSVKVSLFAAIWKYRRLTHSSAHPYD